MPAYNTGIFLLNHGVWRELAALQEIFMNYTWHLMVDLYLYRRKKGFPIAGVYALVGLLLQDEQLDFACVDLPARYEWIVGQIACWLTLGRIKHCTHGGFDSSDVLQGLEFLHQETNNRHLPIVVHYFTKWERQFTGWLEFREANRKRSYVYRKWVNWP